MSPRTLGLSVWVGISAMGATLVAEAAPPPAREAAEPVPVLEDSLGTLTAPVYEVRARRPSRQERLDRRPGFATVLYPSAWAGSMASSATVLSSAVGVTVRQTGGIAGAGTMSIRGSSAGQVPIYLDGIPLATPDRGVVNLADIDLTSLERIEIYRGSAPLLLGGSSLGGAVHLHTASVLADPWVRVTVGSHRTRILEAGGGARAGTWSFAARGRTAFSQGDWDFLDDRGTLYNLEDDRRTARINNDVRGGGVLLSATRAFRGWTFSVSELLDAREQGEPGLSLVQSDDARTGSLAHQLRLSLEADPERPGRVRALDVAHRFDRQTFQDPEGDLQLGRTDREDEVHSLDAATRGAFTPGGGDGWRLEARWARLLSQDRLQAQGDGQPQTRLTAAAAVQPSFWFAHDRLLVSPGFRIEMHRDRFHGTPPFSFLPLGPVDHTTTWASTVQLGARWRVAGGLSLKANLAHATRVPTLLERFGVRGTIVGNPDLEPETGVNRDAGVVWTEPASGRRVALTLFDNDQWDLIAFRATSAATARAFNVGRAAVRGVEVEVDFGWAGAIHNAAHLTALSAVDRTDSRVASGEPLPGRPAYQVEYRFGVRVGPVELGYRLAAVGRSYAQTGGRAPIPGRVLHDLHGRSRLGAFGVHVRVENVTDEESFDLWGYPLPGRTGSISLSTGLP